MSLINDALRRARLAQGQTTAQPSLAPLTADPLSPVEYRRHPTAPLWVLPASGILAACALFLIAHWWRSAPVAEVQANMKSVASAVPQVEETFVASSSAGSNSSTNPGPEPALPLAPTLAVEPVPVESEPVAPAAEPPGEAPFPELRLQGIFYRGAKSIALINDQSVSIGDQMEGARIRNITRQTVTVVHGASTNVLRLR